MPITIVATLLSPPKLETTIYAILLSFINFGNSIASFFGIGLVEMFQVKNSFQNIMYIFILDILVRICICIHLYKIPSWNITSFQN